MFISNLLTVFGEILNFIIVNGKFFLFLIILSSTYHFHSYINNGNDFQSQISFPLSRFSTKTPYTFSKSKIIDESSFNDYKLLRLIVLARHSSRYPTKSNIENYNKTFYKLNQKKLSYRYEWISSWRNKFSLTKQGLLSSKGIQEATKLGRQYYFRFRNFFMDLEYPSQIIINATYKERAISSAKHFIKGLFTGRALRLNLLDLNFNNNSMTDVTLRFFDMCKKGESSSGQKIFLRSQFSSDIQSILKNINSKLGTQDLDDIDLYSFWSLCEFETINYGKSRFCSLFNSTDALILERIENYVHYFMKANPNFKNGKISCPLLKNIVDLLNMTTYEEKDKLAAFYFAHAETLIPLLKLINISIESFQNNSFHPTILPKDHTFVYGLLSPMSANLAFLLYYSSDGKYYVKLKLNELDVYLGDSRNELVSLDYILNLYNLLCYEDYDKLCI